MNGIQTRIQAEENIMSRRKAQIVMITQAVLDLK
jgi:hypothetical protein